MMFLFFVISFSIYSDLLSVRNYKSFTSRLSWESKYGVYVNSSVESNYDKLLSRGTNSTFLQIGYERNLSQDRKFQIATNFGFKLERRGETEVGRRNLLLKAFYETPLFGFLKINPSFGFDFLEYFGTSRTSLDNSGWDGSLTAEVVPVNMRLLFFVENKNLYKESRGSAEINRAFFIQDMELFFKYNLERKFQRYTIQREEALHNTHHRFNLVMKKNFSTFTRVEVTYSGDFNNLDYGRKNIKTNSKNNYSFDFRMFTKLSFLNFAFNFGSGRDVLDYKVIKNDEFVSMNHLSFDIQKTGNLFGGFSMDLSIERYNYPELTISPERDARKLHIESFMGFSFRNYTNVLKFSGTRYDLSYIKSYYSANSKYTYKLYLTDRSFYTRGDLQFFTEFEVFSQFSLFPYDAYRGIFTRYFLNNLGIKKGESNLWQIKFKFQDQGNFVRDVETDEYFYVKRVSIFEINFISNTFLGRYRNIRVFSKNSLTTRYRQPVNSKKSLDLKDLSIGLSFSGESLSVEFSRMFRYKAKDYFTLSASYSKSL